MTDIIERLEAATEGSRELDSACGDAIGWTRWASLEDCPHYTTSIDAALTLLDENWAWIISKVIDLVAMRQGYTAVIECLDGTGDVERPMQIRKAAEVVAATPALALCIAALKAKTTLPHNEKDST